MKKNLLGTTAVIDLETMSGEASAADKIK